MPAFHPTKAGQPQVTKLSAPALLEQAGQSYTCLPDHFLDYIAPTLTPTEMRVMVYIYRRTLGHNKLADSISYDQFIQGITTRDGRKLDQGAGVSRRALVTALAGLEERGLISRHHLRPDPASPPQPALIRINLNFSTKTVDNSVDSMVEDSPPAAPPDANFATQQQPEVQLFPAGSQKEVQKSSLSIESHESQKTDRDRDPAAVALLTEKIPGITKKEARKLVRLAVSHGRNHAYLTRLVDHVLSQPAIRVPAAVLTTLIQQDADRMAGPPLTEALSASKQRPPGTGPASVPARPSIDFSKYAAGGKYGYLTSSRSAPAYADG